jgi:hypothetical protein
MNVRCDKWQDRIVDYVLKALTQEDTDALLTHIRSCPACEKYLRALQQDSNTLLQFGQQLEVDMPSRINSVIEAFKLTEPTTRVKKILVWRKIMASSVVKIAAAVIVVVAALITGIFGPRAGEPQKGVLTGFPLLATACAAEDALFASTQVVYIKNEIIVYPAPAFRELGFTWLPMCSLKADGKFRFDQLRLSLEAEPYTVTDQAWYDPTTGRFVRLLQTAGQTVFANSYDGQSVYTLDIGEDGQMQTSKKLVTEEFKAPQKPADFFGLAAGLRSGLDKSTPQVQSVEMGKLDNGSPVHIFKVGLPDPNGRMPSYWLFKVRDDDGTIAEKEFVIDQQRHMLIRRVLNQHVDRPEVSWNLAELTGSNIPAGQKPRASVTPDMVIPNVSIQHMVEKASFETYVFSNRPSWTNSFTIIDCIDPASFGKRMFLFACRADDGRHVVLVQSPSYNAMLGNFVKQGTLVYTSPNGFKVWSGGRDKWFAQILLESARAEIKDRPCDDRTGYILESPAGTFPALAINGPVTKEELHSFVDSLVPAKEYLLKNAGPQK